MEGRAGFGKNRKLLVIVILCADGLLNRFFQPSNTKN